MKDDQHFQVKTDTANLSGNVKVTGSPNNEKFYDYIDFLGKQRIKASEIQQEMQNADLDDEKMESLEEDLKQLNRKSKEIPN